MTKVQEAFLYVGAFFVGGFIAAALIAINVVLK